MNTFQIIMLAFSAFFAYKVYEHVMNLKDENKDESQNSVEEGSKDIKPSLSLIDPVYLLNKADEAFKRGDLKEAQLLLEEAHAKDRLNIEIINKLAFIYSKNSQKDDALELYKQSIEIDDSDDLIHNSIASLYKNIGEYDKAEQHYTKALSIDDEYAITYFNYANLSLEMGNKLRAKELYEKAYELDHDLTEAKEELDRLKIEEIV